MKVIAPKRTRVKLPGSSAGYDELADFFEKHDTVELLEQGIMVEDTDHFDLQAMRLEYQKQPNSQQLNIRIPKGAKRMIERLTKRKTVEVSTLVRMWVIESMRREASQP
jgi:16S rRNA U516 pseudouridylate synthase RsuA-like enzyme